MTDLTLPSGATLAPGSTGSPTLTLATAGGTAQVALFGATVVSFVPHQGSGAGRDLLWLSPKASIAGDKPIRGGVPLCGPWFGPHATVKGAPAHGLMRIRTWTLRRVEALADGRLQAVMELALPSAPELGWLHHAEATCTVTVGATLAVELTVRNRGPTPFLLSGALHTYFAVSDVRQVRVDGLGDRAMIDFTGGGVRRRSQNGPVALTGEAAWFFLSSDPVRLVDPVWDRAIAVRGWGAGATVVWNPWDKTAATMADLGDGWPGFLCVENANVPDTAVPLAVDCSHHLGVEIGAEGI